MRCRFQACARWTLTARSPWVLPCCRGTDRPTSLYQNRPFAGLISKETSQTYRCHGIGVKPSLCMTSATLPPSVLNSGRRGVPQNGGHSKPYSSRHCSTNSVGGRQVVEGVVIVRLLRREGAQFREDLA